jgi:OOP family OmpA-OmpF porin
LAVAVVALLATIGFGCSLVDQTDASAPGDPGTSSGERPEDDTERAESDPAGDDASGEPDEPRDSQTPAVDEVIPVALPTIPIVALPDVSELTATGDLVAAQLGDLVTGPLGGVELVSVDCADGGDLIYSGSQRGTDVFDIGADGSGQFREETDDGLVTLEVDAEGSGRFYDSTGGDLTTIEVASDGTGEYYRETRAGLVTVKVSGPATGEYYDDRNDRLLTVELLADGSGRYYLESETGLVTVDAGPDGSGEYFAQQVDTGSTTTLRVEPGGTWKLTTVTASQRWDLEVLADGSGRSQVSGLESASFDFDTDGVSLDPAQPVRLALPPAPRFVVAEQFPPLGRLGSLTPPCATVIRFDAALLFDFGEAELRPETVELLGSVVSAIEQIGRPIEVVGHTDAVGSEQANLELSLDRARAVEAALRDRGMTVAAEVVGLGESRPVAADENPDGSDNPAGRAENRRVELVIREAAP